MATKTYDNGYYWVRYWEVDPANWEIAEHYGNTWWSVMEQGLDYESDVALSEAGYEIGPKLVPPPANYSANAEQKS